MAGEVIGRSSVFEEDDTTFCFLVISDFETSPGFAVGQLSDAVYSGVFTSVSTPTWSTLCRSVGPRVDSKTFCFQANSTTYLAA
jgi:hypothetical protein